MGVVVIVDAVRWSHSRGIIHSSYRSGGILEGSHVAKPQRRRYFVVCSRALVYQWQRLTAYRSRSASCMVNMQSSFGDRICRCTVTRNICSRKALKATLRRRFRAASSLFLPSRQLHPILNELSTIIFRHEGLYLYRLCRSCVLAEVISIHLSSFAGLFIFLQHRPRGSFQAYGRLRWCLRRP